MSTFERRRPQRLPELLLLTPAHSCAVLVLATLPPPFMSHTSDGVSVRVPPPFMSHTSDASAGIKQSHTDSAACGSSLESLPHTHQSAAAWQKVRLVGAFCARGCVQQNRPFSILSMHRHDSEDSREPDSQYSQEPRHPNIAPIEETADPLVKKPRAHPAPIR